MEALYTTMMHAATMRARRFSTTSSVAAKQPGPVPRGGQPIRCLSRSASGAFVRGVACALSLLLFASIPAQGQTLQQYASWQAGAGQATTVSGSHPSVNGVPNVQDLSTIIALRLEGATVEEALQHIAEAAGLELVYGSEKVAVERTVNLSAAQISAQEALHEVLRGTGLGLVQLAGGQLVVVDQAEAEPQRGAHVRVSRALDVKTLVPARLTPLQVLPQQVGTISGTVIEAETGQPLPGVNVVIVGTQQGGSTDGEGRYTIPDVEAGIYTLRASFVGYGAETEEGVTVRDGETTTVDLTMQARAQGLEEVVVVGYGTQRRSDLTGSVASVDTDEIAAQPVSQLSHALQGRAAGVEVTNTNAEPGGGVRVRIRGATSISAGSDPLYVVDGVAGANINDLSPQDVESIDILKDASSTAIYGARGANGVVVITTKSGQAGAPRVTLEATPYSYRNPTSTVEVLNAEQFARYINEVRVNSGGEPLYENPEALGEGTDHLDTILRNGNMQQYQLSVSGGNEAARYYISGNVYDETGVLIDSDFQRYSFRSNVDVDASDRLHIGLNLFAARALQDGTAVHRGRAADPAITAAALRFNPSLGIYDENGNYTIQTPGDPHNNAYALATEFVQESVNDKFQGSVKGEYDIADGLTLHVRLGANYQDGFTGFYDPSVTYTGRGVGGRAQVTDRRSLTLLNEDYLSYQNEWGIHRVNAQAGYSYQTARNESNGTRVEGFPSDAFEYHNLGAGSTFLPSYSGLAEWELESFYGRVNYGVFDRYLFTFTARYDGSSRFAENNKYGFFPSGAIAWRASEEPFMASVDAVSLLKLRASYGVTGNTEIGTYRSLATLGESFSVIGGQIVNAIVPEQVANSNLSWESTAQFNLGVDLGLWEDRLSISADYYDMTTSDLLLGVPLPEYSGFSSSLQNVGRTKNRGIEFQIRSYNFDNEAFSWSSDLNFSLNRNEVLELVRLGQEPDEEGRYDNDFILNGSPGHMLLSGTSLLREGEPFGMLYGFVWEGVDPETGMNQYTDLNGDGELNTADRRIIGNPHPDYRWGLNNTFSYKNFDLNVFLQAVIGNDIYNFQRMELEDLRGTFNQSVRVLDRWTPENRNTDVPKATSEHLQVISSRFVEDGSHIRLRNTSLSYNLPREAISFAGLRTMRLTLSAQNLFTITDYLGFDPEVNTRGSSNTLIGLDYGAYPRARSVSLSFHIGL